MWTRSYSIVTKEVTKEQMWKLFADVNNWHSWDKGIEYAKMEGDFKTGNSITLKPQGGPEIKVEILDVIENKRFLDVSIFPWTRLYDDHLFEETEDGLKITITIRLEGSLWFVWRKLVAQNIVDNLPREMLEQIKFASKL